MAAESELNAHTPDCSFERWKERFMAYVNNIAVLGLNREAVDNIMAKKSIRTA